MKAKYIEDIVALLEMTNDLTMLDLVYRILSKCV